MRDVFLAGAVRTPIGKFGGSLRDTPAPLLGAVVIREALGRCGIPPTAVDEVILGNVIQAGLGQNPARRAAIAAGLPVEVPSYTVNKVCASGLKAVVLAAQAIALGDASVVVAGGMENMSAAPFLLRNARWGYKMGDDKLVDAMVCDALWEVFNDYHMGVTAENLAAEFGISREEQDAFAAASQAKAGAAVDGGRFADELAAVPLQQSREPAARFEKDEHPRPSTTPQILAKLAPAFKPDGTVTAGNASGINDGAAALIVLSSEAATRHSVTPMARIISYAASGVDPARMGIGPVGAVRMALQKANLSLDEIDLIEINEAFAVQTLAVMRELHVRPERLNVHGGAIALGHPVGASGARILVTLLHAMKQRGARRGLAALCVGGGQGMAVVVEA